MGKEMPEEKCRFKLHACYIRALLAVLMRFSLQTNFSPLPCLVFGRLQHCCKQIVSAILSLKGSKGNLEVYNLLVVLDMNMPVFELGPNFRKEDQNLFRRPPKNIRKESERDCFQSLGFCDVVPGTDLFLYIQSSRSDNLPITKQVGEGITANELT